MIKLQHKRDVDKNEPVKPWRTASHSFETAALRFIDYKLMLVAAFLCCGATLGDR